MLRHDTRKVRRGVRQGDVLLKPISADQISGKPVAATNGHFFLAEGEESGHHHCVPEQPNVGYIADGISAFLTVDASAKPAKLLHQLQTRKGWKQADHDPHTVESGDYEVVIQRRVLPGFEHKVTRSID